MEIEPLELQDISTVVRRRRATRPKPKNEKGILDRRQKLRARLGRPQPVPFKSLPKNGVPKTRAQPRNFLPRTRVGKPKFGGRSGAGTLPKQIAGNKGQGGQNQKQRIMQKRRRKRLYGVFKRKRKAMLRRDAVRSKSTVGLGPLKCMQNWQQFLYRQRIFFCW